MQQVVFRLMVVSAIAATRLPAPARAEGEAHPPTQRRVMAFYYPWYGTVDGPGGAGRTVHWGLIDTDHQDIAASTHYPQLGPYDSHDEQLIEQHCRWAEAAHIDTLIVSWWGHGHYTDRPMQKILDACARHGMKACIYYETVPRPQTPQTAAADIVRVLEKYGAHRAHLKVGGRPVVFIYGRALNELGLSGWHEAIQAVQSGHEGGVTAIGDQFSYGSARVFDGVHTYNTAGLLRGLSLEQVGRWSAETYAPWVRLADQAGAISTITVIPGYDDTKIRTPGLAVERYDGQSYRTQWAQAIDADPHWVLITSFNEWHEGSEIEPSSEYGHTYLDLTGEYAWRFKATPRQAHEVTSDTKLSEQEMDRLRTVLSRKKIAALPGAESMALWWLIDAGVKVETLTWEDIVGGTLTFGDYAMVVYGGGEHFRRTLTQPDDVDEALTDYLDQGGFLVVLPSLPWPFYYDETGTVINRSHLFGVTLRMGWETPPQGVDLYFVRHEDYLPHLPKHFAFPTAGDLRWRGFFARNQRRHIPLLRLRNSDDEHLGGAVAYAERREGGRILYVWFGLLNGPYAEPLLYDVFTFAADQLRGSDK